MDRLERLAARRIDESVPEAALEYEVYKSLDASKAVRYAIGAMQPVDPAYTANTFKEGDKVKNQLRKRLDEDCAYEYQGSTTNSTHIKARSDIDLLAILDRWFWLERPQVAEDPYAGDPVDDVTELREDCAVALSEAFPAVELEDGKSTALTLTGGSLRRQVDVVPASWWHTNKYAETGDPDFRGVKVFDRKRGEFVANTPFLHNRRIKEKDGRTRGGMRKAARLMKTLMYDSEGAVTMSSYNVVSLAYNIDDFLLMLSAPRDLQIVEVCYEYCTGLCHSLGERSSILVPDESRTVFGGSAGATLDQLRALTQELHILRTDILRENAASFKRLAEARVEYQVPIF